MDYLKRSWAVVNLDAVAHNISTVRAHLSPSCKLMGVVKADAYGHGDKFTAGKMAELGVDWFGVSNLEEALSLRAQGLSQPVLIFGITPPQEVKSLAEWGITQTVFSLDYAMRMEEAAKEAGVLLNVHLKLDTGMSRLGFLMVEGYAQESLGQLAQVCGLPHLRATGIYSHFACADELEEDSAAYTKMQFARYMQAVSQLEQAGFHFELRHCCNSAGTLVYPEMHLDMVRPGIALYGIAPSEECQGILGLRPAMELYSTVAQVKRLPEGTFISYGRCYTAHRDMLVATVAIGYADGFERELSNKARILVRGRYAPVVGRVCMDQLMLDVTGIPGVAEGDIATIIGTDGENTLTFDEMARLSGTIAYEKTCLIGRRVPRVYRQGGKEIGVADYVRHQIIKEVE